MEISIEGSAGTRRYDYDTAYRLIKEAGFAAIDWNLSGTWDGRAVHDGKFPEYCLFDKSLDAVEAAFEEELSAIRKYGLKITQAHAPFPGFIPGNPAFTDYSVGVYKKAILLCERVGCKNLIIHGYAKSPASDVNTVEEIFDANIRMYEALIPTLVDTNVTVCLENLFRTYRDRLYAGTCCDPYEACEYIDRLNEKAGKECFGLCLDTGHLNAIHETPRPYIVKLGKRIKTLHVHDNDGIGDLHLAPYSGTFPWEEFAKALGEIGYDGDINFECGAQFNKDRIPDRLVQPFLKLVYECGSYFKEVIKGE